MAKRNAFYAQSGGVTAVINASAAGVIETARKHREHDRQGLRGPQRHHRRAHRGPDRHQPQGAARAIARAEAHARRRLRLVPLQAEGAREEPRAVRAADRGVPRARHRLLLLQRRQRLGRHLPQGLADRGDAGLSAHRGARAEDRRQRPRRSPTTARASARSRSTSRRRCARRRSTSRRWPRPRPRSSSSR